MTYQLLHLFSNLTVAVAGLLIGLSALIIVKYWKVYRSVSDSARLLPIHVMLIGISYSMIAFIVTIRLGDPPPPRPGEWVEWWIYPFLTLAFLMADAALILILKFLSKRGPRYREDNERRI